MNRKRDLDSFRNGVKKCSLAFLSVLLWGGFYAPASQERAILKENDSFNEQMQWMKSQKEINEWTRSL